MSTLRKILFYSLIPLSGLVFGLASALVVTAEADSFGERGKVIQISTPPAVTPETYPVKMNPGGGSPLSPDAHQNTADYMRYEPYNTFPRELDLWNLEGKRMVRSDTVVSPNKESFVYTEVMFNPSTRQTYSKLYLVPLVPLAPPPEPHLPSEDAVTPPPEPVDPATYAARFDPAKTVKIRKSLVGIGYDRVRPYEFKTLTVVDWSASGQRLLFKERRGVLHVGLHTSDILIYDQGKGLVTIYPEVHRIIKHYWKTKGNLAHIDTVSWDIQPLGWEPASDSIVLLKAWAYDKNEKKFLGLWQYDVDAERTLLIQLDDGPIPVSANGWLATPVPIPPDFQINQAQGASGIRQ